MRDLETRKTVAVVYLGLICLAAGFFVRQPPTPPHWYTNPEWWLFIIAIPSLTFLGIQMRANEMAAQAALLNAQAVIESERPWLVVTIEKDETMPAYFFFRVINKGKTPAQLINAGIMQSFDT